MSQIRLLLMAGALVALAGCSHNWRQVSPVFPPDQVEAALSGDHSLWVTSGTIANPHRQVAVVRTHQYRREALETEGVAELRAQARRVGADAVIRVQAHPELTEEIAHRPGNLTRVGTRWVTLYSLSGIAIAFDGPPPPPPSGTALELNLPPVN